MHCGSGAGYPCLWWLLAYMRFPLSLIPFQGIISSSSLHYLMHWVSHITFLSLLQRSPDLGSYIIGFFSAFFSGCLFCTYGNGSVWVNMVASLACTGGFLFFPFFFSCLSSYLLFGLQRRKPLIWGLRTSISLVELR